MRAPLTLYPCSVMSVNFTVYLTEIITFLTIVPQSSYTSLIILISFLSLNDMYKGNRLFLKLMTSIIKKYAFICVPTKPNEYFSAKQMTYTSIHVIFTNFHCSKIYNLSSFFYSVKNVSTFLSLHRNQYYTVYGMLILSHHHIRLL